MQINPNLTGPQNIIALATDPIFSAPTDPNNINVGKPFLYVPNGKKPPNALLVDGQSSNTGALVYLRSLIEDVVPDGAVQKIYYERFSLADTVAPNVTIPRGQSQIETLNAIAHQLGLVVGDISFTLSYLPNANQYEIAAAVNSLVYLPSVLIVNINYSD